MKLSTSTYDITSIIGDEAGIRLLAEAGFDALDFGMFYRPNDKRFQLPEAEFVQYFTHLKEVAAECGTEIHQTHSPMTAYRYTGDEKPGHKYLDLQIKAIRAASLMGAGFIVVHPAIPPERLYDRYQEETQEINFKYYSKLKPFAESYGIKIAIENMWNRDPETKKICPTVCSSAAEMKAYVDMMGRDWFCNCLDTGHGVLTGNAPQDMIRELGDYMEVLHAHDVDGVNDNHDAPYTGVTRWPAVMKALKETGYQGTLNFESGTHFTKFGPRLFAESARMLHAIGLDLVREM